MKRKLLSLVLTACMVLPFAGTALAAQPMEQENAAGSVTVVLDPGHGADAEGAVRVVDEQRVCEKDINLAIAKACKAELEENYQGVKVYMTRSDDRDLSLDARVAYAKSVGADVLVSLHINAAGDAQTWTDGAEVLIPNGNYRAALTTQAKKVGGSILEQLSNRTGIVNRGFIQRDSSSKKYANGKAADYYGLIRSAVNSNLTSMIVEHAFLDSDVDYWNYLSTDAQIQALGQADAAGIAAAYGLAQKIPSAADKGDAPFTDVYENAWYYSDVVFTYQHDILHGTSATTFAPNGAMSRAMVAQAMYSYAGSPAAFGGTAFFDVKKGSWYEAAVLWASANGIISGTGDGKFLPDKNITREEFVQILYGCAGKPAGSAGVLKQFADAGSVSGWAQPAMRWAVQTGIVQGSQTASGTVLTPKATATRAQAAALLRRFAEVVR
ncbi:MAG: N-acetylmuramoyl-L-alanine amidase [Eubacteriales bacterium]|nr:N-acetylmuramoyl-L-alanine amidase [Eubacteriales bacterium]